MSDRDQDPRIERMAQIIHDSRVHLHPEAPAEIRRQRGRPTRSDYEAAMAIYESPGVRKDLAETNMPDGSDWLIARDATRWDEGALWAYEEITGEKAGNFLAPGDNPYRKQATE